MRRRAIGWGGRDPKGGMGELGADLERRARTALPWAFVAVVVALSTLGCGDPGDSAQDVWADDAAEEDGEGGSCVGTPAPCESFYDYLSCQQQAGCGWVFAYNECRNNMPTGPYACELLSDRVDVCLGQVGCRWE